MSEYLSEKEQIEELKNWWRENGRFVLTGLVLGAAILFGWRAWDNYRSTREALASATYNSLFAAVQSRDLELATRLSEELQGEYSDTPYADQAALALAKAYVDSGQPALAAAELERIVRRSDDAVLQHIARLRLASVRLSLGQYEQALAALTIDKPGAFAARYHALRGDVRYAMGEPEAAREEYRLALSSDVHTVIDRNLVQMKLDSLGGEQQSTEEAVASEAAEQ